MKRFVIRNYGPTRQFSYKGKQIFIANDSAIESDDEELAVALKKEEAVHVTDRGSEVISVKEPEMSEEVTEESNEIAYKDMLLKELQILGKDREIKTSGLSKAKLIQALEDYDATPEESKEVLEEVTA